MRHWPYRFPGHTAGSAAYLFADHDVVFTGDALVTRDIVDGHTGPGLISRAFTHDRHDITLQTLAELSAVSLSTILNRLPLIRRDTPTASRPTAAVCDRPAWPVI